MEIDAHKAFTTPAPRPPFCGWKALHEDPAKLSDRLLRRAVLACLIADPLVSAGHIGVAARAGRVTLSGYVTSNAQKDAAGAAARCVKGVERLADELRVAVPARTVAHAHTFNR